MSTQSEPESFERKLDELAHARRRIEAHIEGTPDPQEAFAQATRLTEELRTATNEAGNLRGRVLMRIWESEKMSLAALAQRVGVSKSRADQLVRGAQTSKEADS